MIMSIVANDTTMNIPAPSSFEAKLVPKQKTSEYNSNGVLVRETLPDKWELKFEWAFSAPEDEYAWFSFLKSLTRIYFTVNFPAPTGNIETATFYISPITASMLGFYESNAGLWRKLKCSFMEA